MKQRDTEDWLILVMLWGMAMTMAGLGAGVVIWVAREALK